MIRSGWPAGRRAPSDIELQRSMIPLTEREYDLLALKPIFSIAIILVLIFSVTLKIDILSEESSVRIEGGSLLEQGPNILSVRCLAPDMQISIDGFKGTVVLSNCFRESYLDGYDGQFSRLGNTIRFNCTGDRAEYNLLTEQKRTFKFAVIGDTQGMNEIFSSPVDLIQDHEFVIHCGDLVPSGSPDEYDAAMAVIDDLAVPFHITPGNHDVKMAGQTEFAKRFGPSMYSFNYSDITFAFVDSSDLNISRAELNWLKETFDGAARKIIITHAPLYDPLETAHTLDVYSCQALRDFAIENDVTAIFSGHLHTFNSARIGQTDLIITGGGGASLYGDGTHHFVSVTVTDHSLQYDKIDIDYDYKASYSITVNGKHISLNLTIDELYQMATTGGYSSFENNYGNTMGYGVYSGVLIGDLIGLVGGMWEGDIVTITSVDGYSQEFGFLNVYPDEKWRSIQGDMIIALECDGEAVPEWFDGPRVAILAPDELYSNQDCERTSYDGQGFYVYESAGARWVKNVLSITVEASN